MKKGTWIVFGLALLLGVLYFFTRESQVSVGVKQLKLPTFAHEKVDRIEILGKNPVLLLKGDDGWKVKLPGDGREVRADAANVQALLDAALELRSSHYVTNQKEKYAELGFADDTAITVKLSSKDSVAFVIVLGKNATGAGRYAKLPDDDDVFVMRGSFWQLTRNGVVDFRDREVWPVKDGDVQRFTIVKADGSEIALIKEDAGSFKFDESQRGLPKDFRVDKAALANLVRTATSLRASGFIDEAKQLPSPLLTIKAGSESGSQVLEIFSDSGNKYLARRVGDDQIVEIAKSNVDRLNLPIDALRDLAVLKFDKAAIKTMTLMQGKSRVVIKKEENAWTIVEPKKLPDKFEFDANAVDDLLTMLSGLNAERLATAKDVASSADWQKAWLIELGSDKDEKTHLYVGKTKANKDELLVRGNIDQNVYVVKAMRLSTLQSGINAFKKEEFNLPPIDENTKGFESLPVDIQRKLLDVTKDKRKGGSQ